VDELAAGWCDDRGTDESAAGEVAGGEVAGGASGRGDEGDETVGRADCDRPVDV
jgi:hypothetical protein